MTKKRNRVRFMPLNSLRAQTLDTASRNLITAGILTLFDGTETRVTLSPDATVGLCGKSIVMVDDPALDYLLIGIGGTPRTPEERRQIAEYMCLHSKPLRFH